MQRIKETKVTEKIRKKYSSNDLYEQIDIFLVIDCYLLLRIVYYRHLLSYVHFSKRTNIHCSRTLNRRAHF